MLKRAVWSIIISQYPCLFSAPQFPVMDLEALFWLNTTHNTCWGREAVQRNTFILQRVLTKQPVYKTYTPEENIILSFLPCLGHPECLPSVETDHECSAVQQCHAPPSSIIQCSRCICCSLSIIHCLGLLGSS